jgi:hypothetical protein
MRAVFASVIAASAAACGGSSAGHPAPPPAINQGTVAFTGAVSASNDNCGATAFVDAYGNGRFGLASVGLDPLHLADSGAQLTCEVETVGMPTIGTYASGQVPMFCMAWQNNQYWTTNAVVSITITGMQDFKASATGGGTYMTVHGSLSATLAAEEGTGATGTVNVVASF